jgi:hypothetical protein
MGSIWFSINQSYSDPNYVNVFANPAPPRRSEDQKMVKSATPREFSISNYPNPFNPSTTITFDLPADAWVTLHVFDLLGRDVVTLLNATRRAGRHSVPWHGVDNHGQTVPSGVYLYRFAASPTNGGIPYIALGKLLFAK